MDSENNSRNIWPWILTILIAAWLIGMSIITAGWLISKEVAKNSSETIVSEEVGIQNFDIEIPAGLPVLGDNNAKVTIVEFADFQCPFCGDWHKNVFPKIKEKYIDTGKARFVYMDYAFLGEESYQSAQASKCAQDQNKFWEYHDKLYESQSGENEGAFSSENLKKFALDLGLNTSDFNSCMDNNKYLGEVSADLEKASNYDVQSTPTVFINGDKYEGVMPFETYEQIIEEKLAQ